MEDNIIKLLKIIYKNINFKKLKVKNYHDFFTNKVLVSSKKKNIKIFTGTLCSYLNINSIPKECVIIIDDIINEYNDNDVLNKINDEYMYLSMSGIMLAKKEKNENKIL